MKKKNIALLLSAVLVLVGAVGVTIAWLMDDAGPVTNTFTVGNIDIMLDETNVDDKVTGMGRDTENTYKMIPGFTYEKDPMVTVKANSEDCWLFVKETKSANFDSFLTYRIADDWTQLDGVSGVYYREVPAKAEAQKFYVIDGNTVTVSDQVTKEMMDEVGTNFPTVTFKAAAVQYYKTNDKAFEPKEAYELVKEELNKTN